MRDQNQTTIHGSSWQSIDQGSTLVEVINSGSDLIVVQLYCTHDIDFVTLGPKICQYLFIRAQLVLSMSFSLTINGIELDPSPVKLLLYCVHQPGSLSPVQHYLVLLGQRHQSFRTMVPEDHPSWIIAEQVPLHNVAQHALEVDYQQWQL